MLAIVNLHYDNLEFQSMRHPSVGDVDEEYAVVGCEDITWIAFGASSRAQTVLRVFLLDQLCDRLQLNIARPFVDCADFGVAPELLDARLARETNTTTPLDRLAADLLRNDTRVPLGHCCFLGEREPSLLAACSIVCEQAGSLDLGGGCGNRVLHRLEGADGLAKLLALVRVGNGLVKGALREAEHLSGDADTACMLVR